MIRGEGSGNDHEPIYHRVRWFLGLRDLVITLRTRRCQFGCAFCDLPRRSVTHDVSPRAIDSQIDAICSQYAERSTDVGQISIGNEGSILDPERFPRSGLDTIVSRLRYFPSLCWVSLETRPEFATEARLRGVQEVMSSSYLLDVTVGLETRDDRLRNELLRKGLSIDAFERTAAAAGRLGVRLTTYVLLKPVPDMNEDAAVDDARATVRYLATIRDRFGVDSVVYLNPLYLTPRLAADYPAGTPPTIDMVLDVAKEVSRCGLSLHVGLWSEGLAVQGGDIESRTATKPLLWRSVVDFARHQDFEKLGATRLSAGVDDT